MINHPFDKTDLLAYVTGSCSDIKRALIEKHLPACDACRSWCAGLEAERDAFLVEHPFHEPITLPERAEKARMLPFVGYRYYALAASLVIFVAAAYFYMSGTNTPDFRIKGTVGLKAFVQDLHGGVGDRREGVYHPDEKIQFLYSCDDTRCLILLGIDTTGSITTYYPAAGDSSVALESGQDIPLPNSIALDDYLGPELFVGLFSKRPLPVSAARQALADGFAAGRSIDSISLKIADAVVVTYACTVVPGGGK